MAGGLDVILQSPLQLLELISLLGLAGFIAGLGGFAFSGVASVSLWLLPPITVVPLLLTLSAANQMTSIGALRREMRMFWHQDHGHGSLAFIVGGIFGAPIGVWILQTLPPTTMAAVLGSCLFCFAAAMLILPALPRLHPHGALESIAWGWGGGIVGGFSSFPSSVPLTYLTWRQLPRADMRGVLQPYVLTMQLLSIGLLVGQRPETFNRGFAAVALLALPVVLSTTLLGVRCYRRIGETHFRGIVLAILAGSGLSLVGKSLLM